MGRRRSEPLSESLSGKRGSEGHRFEGTQGRLGSVHQRAFMKPYIGYLIIGGAGVSPSTSLDLAWGVGGALAGIRSDIQSKLI